MQKLVNCNLIEEFDGTALLTRKGIAAAALLSSTENEANYSCQSCGLGEHLKNRVLTFDSVISIVVASTTCKVKNGLLNSGLRLPVASDI